MAHLLIIDDEAPIRTSLREILEYEGHRISEAATGMDGVLAATKTKFDGIFCDVKMPQMDGLDVLDMLAKKGVQTPVVMISGHGTVDTAVASLKKGAYDFIQKPLDLNRVLVTLRNMLEREALVETTQVLKKKAHNARSHTIVGESEAIREILGMVETVAPTEARVLVTGANGAGKELVARQIHNGSPRAEGPFVEVNCAAIPGELIESELSPSFSLPITPAETELAQRRLVAAGLSWSAVSSNRPSWGWFSTVVPLSGFRSINSPCRLSPLRRVKVTVSAQLRSGARQRNRSPAVAMERCMASAEKPLGLKPQANGNQGSEAGDQHGDLQAQR